jgi:glycosyltransferase involved in cell wall biosynthesis
MLVLKAILLADQTNSFEILSSGQTFDHRNQSYFKSILNFIKINKLKNRYKILGVVPFEDMCSLMYYSVAVINPSKSEGWGNSAEQANLIGKRVLLSDIPVHIEQKKKNYFYFSKDNPSSLFNLMIKILKKQKKTKKQISYEKNILNNEKEERFFVKNYLNLLLKCKNR